jgi:hypothetical protein
VGRASTAAVVGVVAGFAVGFAARGCSDGPHGDAAPGAASRDAPTRTVVEPRAPTPRARPESTPSDVAAVASSAANFASSSVAPDVREIPLDDAPKGWADVEIELVEFDGRLIQNHRVDAAAAGERDWRSETLHRREDGASVDTSAAGRGRLPLASPARFDFFVHRSLWWVWVLDVPTPATRFLRIVDAPRAEIEVTNAETLAPEEVLQLRLAAVPGESARLPDGTGIAPTANEDWFELSAEHPVWRREVPAALRWRIQGRESSVVEPVDVSVPAKVQVRRAVNALTVHAGIDMEAAARFGRRRVPIELTAPGGPAAIPLWVGAEVAKGSAASTAVVRVGTPTGIVRWRGTDVVSGEAAYDLARSSTLDIEVTCPSAGAQPDPFVRLEIADGIDVPRASLECVVRRCEQPFRSREFALQRGVDTSIPGGDASWASVMPFEGAEICVAGPVRLSAGGTHVLRFAPGGFVVVNQRGRLPDGAGTLTIGRADGAPLLLGDMGDVRVEIESVGVLGPFPPGEILLDAFVGGVRWARYAVTVRADDHTPLPVGPFGRAR